MQKTLRILIFFIILIILIIGIIVACTSVVESKDIIEKDSQLCESPKTISYIEPPVKLSEEQVYIEDNKKSNKSNEKPTLSHSQPAKESSPEETWPYDISPEEIDLIALVTMGEAEGECEEGKRLVIDTILNRVDSEHFPDTVYDVVYQKHQFSAMWGERIKKCYVMDSIVELVKEELENRTNYECVFFHADHYGKYGVPMFQVGNHYFSKYE